jgi:hypothetical protein
MGNLESLSGGSAGHSMNSREEIYNLQSRFLA